MKLFYIEMRSGCGLRAGKTAKAIERAILKEFGTSCGLKSVHEATDEEVWYVYKMGGYVPVQFRNRIETARPR